MASASLQYIKIDSNFRNANSTSVSDFFCMLDHPIQGTYRLEELWIPNTEYTVDTGNATIYFNENSTDKTATIASGYYTSSTICSAVKTALDTASSGYATFSCSYSTLTKKITISSTQNFSLTFGTNTSNSSAKTLGFAESDTSAGTSHTGTRNIDLIRSKTYNILLNNVMNGVNQSSVYFTFTVPNYSNSGGLCLYHHNSGMTEQTVSLPQRTNRVNVQLQDENGTVVDLEGSDWYLLLKKIF